MKLSSLALKIFGWKVQLSTPNFAKSIICVAPHTSNWDFVLGELAIQSVGRKSGFLMKQSWFFPPMNIIFKSMGGIPVPRKKKGISITTAVIDKFNRATNLNIAITPEGTRKKVDQWKTGFLHIAYGAKIPVQLAAIDYERKTISLNDYYMPTGDIINDINYIKNYYLNLGVKGKYPNRFSTAPQVAK